MLIRVTFRVSVVFLMCPGGKTKLPDIAAQLIRNPPELPSTGLVKEWERDPEGPLLAEDHFESQMVLLITKSGAQVS